MFSWPLTYYRNIINKLNFIIQIGIRNMATVQQLTDAIGVISADLTKLAADVAALQNQSGGIKPADLDPVLTALQGAATSLEALDTSIQQPPPPPVSSP